MLEAGVYDPDPRAMRPRTPPGTGAIGGGAAPRQPLVLEFVGLPGAGKTTVARHVHAGLAALGYECHGRPDVGAASAPVRALRQARVLMARPGLGAAALRLALARGPASPTRLRFALQLAAWPHRWARLRAAGGVMAILEEGVVQNVWSLLIGQRGDDSDDVHAFLRRILGGAGVSFAFVYFHIAVDTAARRVALRGDMTGRFDRMSDEVRRSALAMHRPQLQRLLEQAVQLTNAPALCIDGSAPLQEVVRHVLAFAGGTAAARGVPRRSSSERGGYGVSRTFETPPRAPRTRLSE